MDKLFDLPTIQSLAASGAYSGERTLSDSAAVLLLCAAAYLSNTELWQGAGYELTDSEIDTIKAMVADATDELLTDSEGDVGDYVKLDESVHTSDTAYIEVTELDFTGYQRAIIFVSGMLSDDDVTWAEHALLQLNDIATASHYNSFGEFEYVGGPAQIESLGTKAGIILPWAVSSTFENSGYFGNAEIVIFNPMTINRRHIMARGMVGGATTGQLSTWASQGTKIYTAPLTEVKILPELGSTFLINPAVTHEPNELRMTVFGVK